MAVWRADPERRGQFVAGHAGLQRRDPQELAHLKDLRAPWRTSRLEDGVRLCNGAGAQLFYTQRTCKLRPGKAGEINRAERTDIAANIRGFARAVDAIATNAPA